MLEIGHSRDVRLFGYLCQGCTRLEQDWLIIEQPLGNNWSDGRQGVRPAVGENGVSPDRYERDGPHQEEQFFRSGGHHDRLD